MTNPGNGKSWDLGCLGMGEWWGCHHRGDRAVTAPSTAQGGFLQGEKGLGMANPENAKSQDLGWLGIGEHSGNGEGMEGSPVLSPVGSW